MNNYFEVALTLSGATVVAAVTAIYYLTREKPEHHLHIPVDLNCQSVVLDEKEGIRCSAFCPDGKMSIGIWQNVTTVYESFLNGLQLSKNDGCLGWRTSDKSPYQWMTYHEVYQCALNLGSALVNCLQVKPGNDSYIAIIGQNSKEWCISQLAATMFSMITVPLYETLGREGVTHIITQTEVQVIFCEGNKKIQTLLKEQDPAAMRFVKHIILFEPVTQETKDLCDRLHSHIQWHTFAELTTKGALHQLEPVAPKPNDIYAVCYTSGTTGIPKGCLISHDNLVNDIFCTVGTYQQTGALSFSKHDSHISYLPLAHMYEQSAHVFMFVIGGRIGYFRGDIRGLLSDVAELKPTTFCAVPRVLNRIYDKVMLKFNRNALTRRLLQMAIDSKLEELKRGVLRQNTIWDFLFFSKIRNLVGGQVRLLLTGSAPISKDVMNFMRAVFSCMIVEGYGQSEATAAVTSTLPGEFEAGHVGPPIPCNHVKLVDVPEMGLDWRRDGRGEVCIRGPNCIKGYLKIDTPILDEDGWLHTGDVGSWTPNGALKIVDRCKHMFKLSQGEYISPEKIEQCLLRCPYISQIFVDGNSFQCFCMAVVVPDYEVLLPADQMNDIRSQRDLCRDPGNVLKNKILKSLHDIGRQNDLKGFELVKDIHLSAEAFSVESDLLTPTMKIKRPQMREYFKSEIQKLYATAAAATH